MLDKNVKMIINFKILNHKKVCFILIFELIFYFIYNYKREINFLLILLFKKIKIRVVLN